MIIYFLINCYDYYLKFSLTHWCLRSGKLRQISVSAGGVTHNLLFAGTIHVSFLLEDKSSKPPQIIHSEKILFLKWQILLKYSNT